jgi:heme-degrading monooxygenase HmoA
MTPGHHEDSSPGFVYVWEFTVDAKWQTEFESAYGPDGAWAQLFKKHSGYRGTQLLRHNEDPLKYWTVDHWDSEASQRDFRLRFSAEFEDVDHRCEAFTQKEELLSEFSLVVRTEPGEWAN